MRKLIAAALLAASTIAFAQSERRIDCSRAQDPKACEERLAKAKAAHDKARQACDARKGDERRECMRKEMCAQSPDPAKCEAGVRERVSQRGKMREACKDRKGEALSACIREQRAGK